MAESKSRLPRTPTTPESFPVNPPSSPLGDYSYTVELVGQIQNQLGKLTEAVDSLRQSTKEHGDDLKTIGKDIHALKIIGVIATVVAGFIRWLVKNIVLYSSHPIK